MSAGHRTDLPKLAALPDERPQPLDTTPLGSSPRSGKPTSRRYTVWD